MRTIRTIFFWVLLFLVSCSQSEETPKAEASNLTIFCVNDVHGQIDNFAKVKYLVNAERLKTNVIVTSAGDLFSGNPVVDNYDPKGYPIIDIMNKIGFDVATIGNHEFDYGPEILTDRIDQSKFPWICANAESSSSTLAQPLEYTTISRNDLRITFLGLIETWGSPNDIIPSSHPWRVQDYTFTPALDMVGDYSNIKETENADLLIALTHLGDFADEQLAQQHSFFDLIIGGHSHSKTNTKVNNTPIFQAGGYLNYLGKIELEIKEKSITSISYNLIDLNEIDEYDNDLQEEINAYNDWPELDEEIGTSLFNHSKGETGCFYTYALKTHLNVDVSFQNTGGVRNTLNQGTITKRNIYEISPFNNGTVIYEMTVAEIKIFLKDSGSGFYYDGILISKSNNEIIIRDRLSRVIPDDYVLKVGINDYIPAVHSIFFPEEGKIQPLTAAETIITFLENNSDPIDFKGYNNYFRY